MKMVHPDSKIMYWWNYIIIAAVIITCATVPLQICFSSFLGDAQDAAHSAEDVVLDVVLALVDFAFLVDIGVNFRLAYVPPVHNTGTAL